MDCPGINPVKDRYSWKPVCQGCGRRLMRRLLPGSQTTRVWSHTRHFGMC